MPQLERRAIDEPFFGGQHMITPYKTRKAYLDSCLTFCAAEAHTNLRGVHKSKNEQSRDQISYKVSAKKKV